MPPRSAQQEQDTIVLAESPLATEPRTKNAEPIIAEEKPARDFGIDIDPDVVYIFEAIDKSPTQRHEIISGESRIYDTVENRIRAIRCHPTAQSIFVDEQDKQDHELKNRQPRILDMYNNHLVVNGSETRTMEFLLSHDSYEGNPKRLSAFPPVFRLQDKEKYEIEKSKQNAYELDALQALKTTDFQDLLPVARIVFGITETSENALKNQMFEKIKMPKIKNGVVSNAQIFLHQLKDPTIVRKFTLQRALDKGIIKFEADTKSVKWAFNKQFITNVSSATPKVLLSDLVDFCMTPNGKDFYAQLRAKEGRTD